MTMHPYVEHAQTGARCHAECAHQLPEVAAAANKSLEVAKLGNAVCWFPRPSGAKLQSLGSSPLASANQFSRWELIQAPLCVLCAKLANGQMCKVPRNLGIPGLRVGWAHKECAMALLQCPECSETFKQGEPLIRRESNLRSYHPGCVKRNIELAKEIMAEAQHQKHPPDTSATADPQQINEAMLKVFQADFRRFDINGNGFIDTDELSGLIKHQLQRDCTPKEEEFIMSQLDTDGDNRINFEEYLRMVFPNGFKVV